MDPTTLVILNVWLVYWLLRPEPKADPNAPPPLRWWQWAYALLIWAWMLGSIIFVVGGLVWVVRESMK